MRITNKPDTFDLERLVELTQGQAWQAVLARIEHEQAKMAADLANAKSWEDTVRLQGRIEGTRDVLAIPGILIAEARNKGKNK